MERGQPPLDENGRSSAKNNGTSGPEQLVELATWALQRSGGNIVRATDLMWARIQNHPRLYRTLLDPLGRNACYDLVGMIIRRSNRVKYETVQPDGKAERVRMAARAKVTFNSLLDYVVPLTNGTKMRDATHEDLVRAAEWGLSTAQTMKMKGLWFQYIAEAVPEGKKVGQVLTGQQLGRLLSKAKKSN